MKKIYFLILIPVIYIIQDIFTHKDLEDANTQMTVYL